MHEVAIASSIVEIVMEQARKNNLTKITKVSIQVGQLSGILEESLQFAFCCITEQTIMQGSILEIKSIKATARCNLCNGVFIVQHMDKKCPKCNRFCDEIITGYELLVESIEGEDNEDY